jgi:YidC/Oxa1 family membrane protein insertase
MNSESRFVLAIVLMLAVLVGTSLLFPPVPPGDLTEAPREERVEEPEEAPDPEPARPPAGIADAVPALPELTETEPLPELQEGPAEPVAERLVRVEGPLYNVTFSNVGATVRSAELLRFESFTRPGPVELVADGSVGILGSRIVVGADTVDLRRLPFQLEPADGLILQEGGPPQTLTFRYDHPTEPFSFEVRYTFDPQSYVVEVSGRARGLERGLLLTELGPGLAFNEVDVRQERGSMAYVANHLQEGIRTENLSGVERIRAEDGPFRWVALKSRYFVVAVLPSLEPGGAEFLGGLVAREWGEDDDLAELAVTQSLASGGTFRYRLLAGPQDYALLSSLGNDLQEVNPVGWRPLRPILRPFVAVVMWVLVFFHENLDIGYGWVLILFGVLMRIVLFPLYHKAMRAQLRNMAVQPLLKDIQTRHKDNPEKMQKELMKLYKEHGFNPLAGCWPMLLPFPILIALFFVFQNTIELRGVPFAWLPDLAAKDPIYVLPVLLGISMFLIQWVSMRTLDDINPQMKLMMWALPVGMVVIFANFPSGLNLYYLTANVATLPQSWWIANERKKVKAKGPPEPVGASS